MVVYEQKKCLVCGRNKTTSEHHCKPHLELYVPLSLYVPLLFWFCEDYEPALPHWQCSIDNGGTAVVTGNFMTHTYSDSFEEYEHPNTSENSTMPAGATFDPKSWVLTELSWAEGKDDRMVTWKIHSPAEQKRMTEESNTVPEFYWGVRVEPDKYKLVKRGKQNKATQSPRPLVMTYQTEKQTEDVAIL